MKSMQKTATKKRPFRPRPFSHSVRIEATFGSAHQRDVGMKNLASILAAWKEVVEAHHKSNVITIRDAAEKETIET
jgi:hypothetical protein